MTLKYHNNDGLIIFDLPLEEINSSMVSISSRYFPKYVSTYSGNKPRYITNSTLKYNYNAYNK